MVKLKKNVANRIQMCVYCEPLPYSASTYRELPQVFTFVRLLPGRLPCPAQLVVEPHEQVPEGLGAWNDVERRRQRAALVKVTHPQLGACKLPLNVSMVLQQEKEAPEFTSSRDKDRHLKSLNSSSLMVDNVH